MPNWVKDELASCDLGAARLDRRLGTLLDRFGSTPSPSIPAACPVRAEVEAADRIFDDAKVTPRKILAPHRVATVARVRMHPVAVVAQEW